MKPLASGEATVGLAPTPVHQAPAQQGEQQPEGRGPIRIHARHAGQGDMMGAGFDADRTHAAPLSLELTATGSSEPPAQRGCRAEMLDVYFGYGFSHPTHTLFMRHLHLYVHLPVTPEGANLPGLNALLDRGRSRPAPAGITEALCQAQGIARQRDWPVAPLSARAAGLAPGEAPWLRLDPVFLDVGVRGPYVRTGLALDEAETAELGALLAPLLAPHGMEVFSGPRGVFHARCAAPPRLGTTPLDEVDGCQPMRFLPTGEDAPLWTRLLHELQMALHDHPLNQARQAAGQPPVNSFWPWGGGRLPPPSTGLDAIWGCHPLLTQLARGLGIAALPCPTGLDGVLATSHDRGLVLLEAAQEGNAAAPFAWEAAWFRPLGRALRLGRLRSATVGLIGAQGPARHITPGAMWRFWA